MNIPKVTYNFVTSGGKEILNDFFRTMPNTFVPKDLKFVPLSKDSVTFSGSIPPKIELSVKQIKNKAQELVQKEFLNKDEFISFTRYYSSENVVRTNVGEEFKDFKGFYRQDKKICCYLEDGEIAQAYMLDTKTGEVKVIDFVNDIKQNYSKSDIEALYYYKYYPNSIHGKLRYNKDVYSGDMKEETLRTIERLKKIYADKSKVSTNRENRIIYRGMQTKLSEEDMAKLQQVGAVFEDKSFCSTTTDLNVAKRFAKGNPVLEIEFPKGAEYIDMDKLFNIDRLRWRESELLLNIGARFQVTGFDIENNIIKVKYLL